MTDLRQAAKAVVDRWDSPKWEWRDQGPTADLIAALRKALEQPEQEPVAVVDEVIHAAWSAGFIEGEKAALAQPEQEPLGWLDGNDKLAQFMHRDLKADHDKRGSATPREYTIPVYAAPPQRPWVELIASTILNLMPSSIPADHDGALMEFARAIEAKLKERNRGATTHCQCAACKNGNIHDSDCSVHNGDALPVGPCDCSLATPPAQPEFYQPAADEAIKILKSLGYVYEPSKTGLAWVAKKSAQPEQRKPLTDEQARDLLPINHNHMTRADLMVWVLRATERVHDIKEQP